MSTHQEYEDVTELTEYLQTLRDAARLAGKESLQECMDGSDLISKRHGDFPSNFYGEIKVSDNAKAHLGDVYHFYKNDSAQQLKLLQDYKQQIEIFSRCQNDQGARLERALALIAELNQTVQVQRNKAPTSVQAPSLSRQSLLSVLSIPKDERTPEESLDLANSFARRCPLKPTTYVDPQSYIPQLNDWLTANGSSLLHLCTEIPARDHATNIALQLINSLRDAAYPIAWSLPIPREQVPMQALIRNIILQLVERYCNATITTKDPIDVTRLTESGNEGAWFDLLQSVLSSVRKCFLVLHLHGDFNRSGEWSHHCDRFMTELRAAVAQAGEEGHVLKVLLVTTGIVPVKSQVEDGSLMDTTCILRANPINIARARKLAAIHQNTFIQQLQLPVLSME